MVCSSSLCGATVALSLLQMMGHPVSSMQTAKYTYVCTAAAATHQLASMLDDVGPCVSHHTRHLHAVPASTLAHDIAIETVQDALMSQL